MKIDKVIAISGKPGLYHLISQTKSGFIAENLDDGKKTNVPASYNVSLLSNVAIYTTTEEVPLAEVFRKIYDKENGGETINHRSPEVELRNYMKEVLPDYDKSRVYHSDLKKLFQWYNILLRKELLSGSKEQKAPKTSEEE
ncbi:Uncharacterised protein [Candidatus Ornithobacterium hominis]|uniref:Uncharacterized protein n=1 Tax=Candidatus Ornithobacterium hominis TaxID=2497989 RepID=A0A383U2Z2_9FLAO|nr:DUF5606 domain-containing protein [Candidatus Ornithobacterium hominis]MCT7905086.1 DUF5606 domain-containing protein [Candidatus Ornithobacterium hominis]SZD73511.1 Uncharacterised protein [Candidatus Ornithobacterium hominis]